MDSMVGVLPATSVHHGTLRGVQSMPRLQPTEEEMALKKTKSIRVRPTEMVDNTEPALRLPLKDPSRPREIQPRSSKLSLFHLFSKPKVEKSRGYTETGVQHLSPTSIKPSNSAVVSESDLSTRLQDTSRESLPARPVSSRSQAVTRMARLTSKERNNPAPQERRSSAFSPPPLFQAYPQATKHGVLEIPAIIPDAQGQKSKAPPTNSQQQMTSCGTIRKIFVLITSGYLLQYTYDGPSDRHPEKILELGKESAAFACDLVPGQPYVLQVSHAVNRHGIVAPNSSSLLTRLGLRGNTSRRMISNCWLILTAADEMESWMTAIRHEIEILGGNETRGNAVVSIPGPADIVKPNLRQLSSPSHRYQVRRDPSKVLSIVSPQDKTLSPPLTSHVKVDEDSMETATIDDIEVEASTIGHIDEISRARATSDAHSSGSSTAQSLEQQQLETIRNSIRVSHASSLTTGLTSRTTSPTLSHIPDVPLQGISDSNVDTVGSNTPYQSLSSQAIGSLRSVSLLALSEDEKPSSRAINDQQRSTLLLGSPIHSPITDGYRVSADSLQAPQKRLTAAQSVPNLKTSVGAKKRHDSKTQSPGKIILDDRPESVLGELPSPSVWAGKQSPNLRKSAYSLASGTELSTNYSIRRTSSQSRRRPAEISRQLNGPSASFSLPLKINAPDQPSSRSVRRVSQAMDQGDVVASPVPVVHTLTAKVDLATRTTISAAHIPPRKSSTGSSFANDPSLSSLRSASSRMSLFPTQTPAFPPSFQIDHLKRSPSTSSLSSHAVPQAAGTALKRPTSMQVRSNHAPFLSSVRNSTQGTMTVNMRPGTTVPIRSLKPSRSSMMMHPASYSPSQDPFYETKLASVALAAEASDRPSPLPSQLSSSSFPIIQTMPTSLTRRPSRIKSRTLLELGMPLAALGPPAPPPRAPLPDLPTVSKPGSPIESMTQALQSPQSSSPYQLGPGVNVGTPCA